jgi:hypothetical protein
MLGLDLGPGRAVPGGRHRSGCVDDRTAGGTRVAVVPEDVNSATLPLSVNAVLSPRAAASSARAPLPLPRIDQNLHESIIVQWVTICKRFSCYVVTICYRWLRYKKNASKWPFECVIINIYILLLVTYTNTVHVSDYIIPTWRRVITLYHVYMLFSLRFYVTLLQKRKSLGYNSCSLLHSYMGFVWREVP